MSSSPTRPLNLLSCFVFLGVAISFLHAQSIHTISMPTGHLKPLGSHRPPDVHIDELNDVPSPKEFWEKYVKNERAVILRGAARPSPGFKLWTDEYLKEKYGDLEVRLEGKREKGNSHIPIGDKVIGRSTIRHFIDNYHDTDRYMVSELPSAMYPEYFVPPCLSCGTFRDRLVEIDIWMSGGNSHSVLHKDAFNAINCLLNGTKHWKLIERKYEKWIHKAWEPDHEIGGYSDINVHKVDMLQHPNIAKVPWSNFTINAGDCLFLPSRYYHQVSSVGPMNLAIALLFSFGVKEYDDKGCNETEPNFVPLSDFDVAWSWPGHGCMTMGHADIWEIKEAYLEAISQRGSISKEELAQERIEEYADLDEDEIRDGIEKAWKFLDPEGKGRITANDINALDLPALRQHILASEPVEPSNTEEYEYTYVDYPNLKVFIETLLENNGFITRKKFIYMYQKVLGGTQPFATEIFDKLTGDADGEKVFPDDVEQNLEFALENFRLRERIDPVPPDEDMSHTPFHDKDEL